MLTALYPQDGGRRVMPLCGLTGVHPCCYTAQNKSGTSDGYFEWNREMDWKESHGGVVRLMGGGGVLNLFVYAGFCSKEWVHSILLRT